MEAAEATLAGEGAGALPGPALAHQSQCPAGRALIPHSIPAPSPRSASETGWALVNLCWPPPQPVLKPCSPGFASAWTGQALPWPSPRLGSLLVLFPLLLQASVWLSFLAQLSLARPLCPGAHVRGAWPQDVTVLCLVGTARSGTVEQGCSRDLRPHPTVRSSAHCCIWAHCCAGTQESFGSGLIGSCPSTLGRDSGGLTACPSLPTFLLFALYVVIPKHVGEWFSHSVLLHALASPALCSNPRPLPGQECPGLFLGSGSARLLRHRCTQSPH